MISVIMVYHKQKKYVEEAINSVLAQTYKNFELLLLNAGNNDFDFIEDIAKKDKRIKHVEVKPLGSTFARTEGVKLSDREYIVFLDPDDKIEPQFLKETYKELSKRNKYGFCYTDSIFFSETQSRRMIQPDYNFFNLINQNYICNCSLIRKNYWLDAGGYNLNNRNYFEDYEGWIRLGRKGFYGYHIPEPLFLYREHKESMTSKTSDFGGIYKSFIIRWYPELYPPHLQDVVNKTLKNIPNNFMSLTPEKQEEIIGLNNA